MATARKHGNRYQVLVFDGYYIVDGHKKKKYRAISAPTKDEAESKALQYKRNRNREVGSEEDFTVRDAIDGYIEVKSGSLSPTTINGYLSIAQNSFQSIMDLPVSKLTNFTLQKEIDHMSSQNSPKTVRNKYGLLISAISYYSSDFHPKVTLPESKPPELNVPTDSDIKKVLDICKSHDMRIAIYLAAFGPLRRGEICALTYEDIHENVIDVNKSMALKSKKDDGRYAASDGWIIKPPKKKSSYRKIPMPDFVIEQIGSGKGRIISLTPDQVTNRWLRLCSKSGLEKVRFHDLRHYGASILHAIGIPDQYIIQRGGWATDRVMKSVYRGTLDDVTIKMNEKANSYFTDVFK